MWLAAIDQFRKSPAIGTGAGTYLYYGRLFRRIQVQADPVHVHNDYLELLAEYGILGMIAMAVFLAAHTRRGLQNSRWLVYYRLRESPDCRSSVFALQRVRCRGSQPIWLTRWLILTCTFHRMRCCFPSVRNGCKPGHRRKGDAGRSGKLLTMVAFCPSDLSLGFLISGAIQSLHFLRSGLSLSSAAHGPQR